MGSALVYVVVVGVVAGAVYLVAALVFGRGEELAPMPPGATPTRLPARDLTGGDVRDLRFQQTVRGYKCSEVDWALERLAAEVDALRARLDVVATARPEPGGPVAPGHAAPDDPALVADDPTGPTGLDPHRQAAVSRSGPNGAASWPAWESGTPARGMEPGDTR